MAMKKAKTAAPKTATKKTTKAKAAPARKAAPKKSAAKAAAPAAAPQIKRIRTAKGRRPYFFDDPNIDKLLAMIMAPMSDV